MAMMIRPARAEDAEAYLGLASALDRETTFMMMEPGERTASVLDQRKRLQAVLATDNQMTFVAENEAGELVGLLGAHGGAYRRNHVHGAYLYRDFASLYRSGDWHTPVRDNGMLGAWVGRAPPGTDRHVSQPGRAGPVSEDGLSHRRPPMWRAED